VPGIVAALLAGRASSPRRVALGLLIAGVATLAGYALFWWIETHGRVSLRDWAFSYPDIVKPWMATRAFEPASFVAHVDASSAAIVGRSWPPDQSNLWLGPAYLAGLIVAAILLRGNARAVALAAAVAVIILVRAVFFSWFDVRNPEWSILTIALLALLGARLAHGEPRWPSAARRAGGLLLVAMMAATLLAHGPFTLRLRRREFIQAMTYAVEEGRDCGVIALGPHVHNALDFLNVPHVLLPVAPGSEEALAAVARALEGRHDPALIVFERPTPWMVAGSPYLMTHGPIHRVALDDLPAIPGVRRIEWGGYTYAVRHAIGVTSR
jgi:hypothetical protein